MEFKFYRLRKKSSVVLFVKTDWLPYLLITKTYYVMTFSNIL